MLGVRDTTLNKKDLVLAFMEFTVYCLLLTDTAVNKDTKNKYVITNCDKYYPCLIDNSNSTYPEFFVFPLYFV